MRISVVFPAYNEAQSIEHTMRRALSALRKHCEAFEVLIVDDCGTDGTGAIADALAAAEPEVRVIHNARNIGQGRSLIAGFREAKMNWVTHNAMDYPFDFEDLLLITPLIDTADVIVVRRIQRAGYSVYRKILSVVNVTLLNVLFGLRLHDYNFVQFYRREALEQMPEFSNTTAFLTPGIIIRAHDMGFRVRELAAEYHARMAGIATAGSVKVILGSVWDMFVFWLRRMWRQL